MTTYTEQLFLYGDVDTEATLLDPVSTVIAYADLTVGSALIFAVVVLLSFVITHWAYLVSLVSIISHGANKLVFRPLGASWALLGWVMLQLRSEGARLNTRHVLLPAFRERVAAFLYESRMYRLVMAVYTWHVPTNQPFATLLRLFGAYCSILVAWVNFLSPASSYLSGLLDLWTAGGRIVYCPHAISAYYLDDRLTRTELSNAWYCFGEKAGQTLNTLVTDTWEALVGSNFIDDGEIIHFYAFAVVSCVMLLAIVALALFTVVPRSALFQRARAVLAHLRDSTDSGRAPIIPTESHLWSMLNQRELDLAEKDAQLAIKTALLTAVSAELQTSKKQQEDNWALVGALRNRRNEAVEARQLEQTLSGKLRLQLDQMSRRLRASDTTSLADQEELARVRHEIDSQHKQLTAEREELAQWRQELSSTQERTSGYEVLVAEKKQLLEANQGLNADNCHLSGDNKRLVGECERFTQERQQMVDEYHRLVSDYEKNLAGKQELFVRESQGLASQNGQLNLALETVQRERDNLLAQGMQLRQEVEAITVAAQATYSGSQDSLAKAQHAEQTLQQSMADLKRACDESLAHERQVARKACHEAASLRGEVELLNREMGLALRDADRASKSSTEQEEINKVLNHRLERFESVERGGTQEIPKRQTGSTKSMATALSEQQVKSASQMAEIASLRDQIDKLKKEGPVPPPADGAAKAALERMRAALEKERREKKEDSVRWGAKVRELEESTRKLTVSLSNAEARGGSARRSPNSTPLRSARR